MTDRVPFDLAGKRVWVAGATGLVGSALVRRLGSGACDVLAPTRRELDLRRQDQVERWLEHNRPDAVFLAAAHVGGIMANASQPAEFIYDNLAITTHVMEAAHRSSVRKLLFLGSCCIYPRLAPPPIREDALLTGPLEPTNQWYAIAKIAGLKMAQAYRRQYGCDFISAMPANLYGPGDNFDLVTSHVLPALIRKTHEAKKAGAGQISIWGSGRPHREFLHVDDCADALVFLMKNYSEEETINVGTGESISILALAQLVAEIVGFAGTIETDPSKPDGTPRRFLDTSRLSHLGWSPHIPLRAGITATYQWFLEHRRKFD